MIMTYRLILSVALLAVGATKAAAQEVPDIGASIDVTYMRMHPPAYPDETMFACIGGTVILRIDVDNRGSAANAWIEKSSENTLLDEAALRASRSWRYNPGMEQGESVAGMVRVPVEFKLDKRCWTDLVPDIAAYPQASSMELYPWPGNHKHRPVGMTVLLVRLDEKGAVHSMEVAQSSGDTDTDSNAVNTAIMWDFTPAFLKGKPVRSSLRLPMPYGEQH